MPVPDDTECSFQWEGPLQSAWKYLSFWFIFVVEEIKKLPVSPVYMKCMMCSSKWACLYWGNPVEPDLVWKSLGSAIPVQTHLWGPQLKCLFLWLLISLLSGIRFQKKESNFHWHCKIWGGVRGLWGVSEAFGSTSCTGNMIWAQYKNSGIYTFVLDVRSSFNVMVHLTAILMYACTPIAHTNYGILMFLLRIGLAVAVQSQKPSWEGIAGWMCRQTSFSSENCGHCWPWPCSLFFPVSSSQFSHKYMKQHSQLSMVRKALPVCQRVNIFLSLCDKIVPQRKISPLMLLHWEMAHFLLQQQKHGCGTAERESLYPVGLTLTCSLCNTTGGRSPMWHQISIGNQDQHVLGSWVMSAVASLSSESSVSVLGGSNSEKLWGKILSPASECYHGRFHLATCFMLKS